MKQLRMTNGDVRESERVVCRRCQRPGDVRRFPDGEFYHGECVPEGL